MKPFNIQIDRPVPIIYAEDAEEAVELYYHYHPEFRDILAVKAAEVDDESIKLFVDMHGEDSLEFI